MRWWTHKGSNLGPLPCEGNALPLSYASGIFVYQSKACKSALGPTNHAVRARDLRSAGHRCQAVRTQLPPGKRRFARKRRFLEADQGDLGRPVPSAKIFPFLFEPNHLLIFRHPGPHRGAFRDRHGRRVGMRWTQAAPKTRAPSCGRRSRVVLTPRRWRQASRKCPRGDGDNQARSPGRARRKP
jgi:hypothetical protein